MEVNEEIGQLVFTLKKNQEMRVGDLIEITGPVMRFGEIEITIKKLSPTKIRYLVRAAKSVLITRPKKSEENVQTID